METGGCTHPCSPTTTPPRHLPPFAADHELKPLVGGVSRPLAHDRRRGAGGVSRPLAHDRRDLGVRRAVSSVTVVAGRSQTNPRHTYAVGRPPMSGRPVSSGTPG